MSPVQRCRSCTAEIIWGSVVPGGRVMPIDAEPAPGGTVQVVSGPGQAVRLKVLGRTTAAAAGPPLYTSHFATCPQAAAWRRK